MFKMLYRIRRRPLSDASCYNESKMKVKKGMREEGQRERKGTVVGKIFRINRTKDKGLGNKKDIHTERSKTENSRKTSRKTRKI
jgi:hypothetical protein